MCDKCLYLRDGDDGMDWQPVHIGVMNFKHTSRRKQKSPNWVALRGLEPHLPNYKNLREHIDYEEGQSYTDRELEQLADQFLREEARSVDPESGKPRGIGGENPILFDEHIYARRRREIFNSNGVPDPSLVSGLYHRTHPQGRKVNTKEQRERNGASFYR